MKPEKTKGISAPPGSVVLFALLLCQLARQSDALDISSRREIIGSASLVAKKLIEHDLSSCPPPPLGSFRLFLCRHGETEYNRLGLAQGRHVDADLNSKGEKQAHALAYYLSREPIDFVYSSTLRRASRTADIIADRGKGRCERVKTPTLDEIDFGDLEGKQSEREIARAVQHWCAGDLGFRVGNHGESGFDVAARVREALQLMSAQKGNCFAAVSHSSYLRSAIAIACGLPLGLTEILDQRNCCVNIIDVPRDFDLHARALGLNRIEHLTGLTTRRYSPPVTLIQDTAALAVLRYRVSEHPLSVRDDIFLRYAPRVLWKSFGLLSGHQGTFLRANLYSK
mmetsp:Transcript_33917/g.67486  ORF Transcript_33917/g.67486 Transcript_33917/m.67486 type:complete len:340 (+) Transcript_33917:120-1139(+)